MHFMIVKKSRKRSGFVIYSFFKDSAFTAIKREENALTRYVKGVAFINKRHTKGLPFLSKTGLLKGKSLDLAVEPHPIKLC